MTTSQVPTDRFSGNCEHCVFPVVVEIPDHFGDYARSECPSCHDSLRLERLYGTYSDKNCNVECQFAIGGVCSCSCGGANHRKGYIPVVSTGEVRASALEHFRQAVARNRERGQARKAANAEHKATEAQNARDAFLEDHGQLIDFLRDHADQVAQGKARYDDFYASLLNQFETKGTLSPRQVDALARSVDKARQRAENLAARIAHNTPVPTGRVTVEGTVVKVVERDGYAGGVEFKMTVEGEGGWKVWATVPQSIEHALVRPYGWSRSSMTTTPAIGARVRFTATVEASQKDPTFGFGKRPTKAEIISLPEADRADWFDHEREPRGGGES